MTIGIFNGMAHDKSGQKMTIRELYLETLRIVEEVTETDRKDILASNHEEDVDARHILVNVLSEMGFSNARFSGFMGLTRPGVCMIRNGFRTRGGRFLANMNYKKVKEMVLKVRDA